MQAGKLDRVIAIETKTTEIDYRGTPEIIWSPFATVRAQLLRNQTSDTEAGASHRTDATLDFRIRFLDSIDLEMRVLYEGNAYTIQKIVQLGRRVGLDLVCERVGL